MPPLFLLPVLLLLFATAHGYPSICSNATCGDLTIAYPFWLNSSTSSSCGYSGLGLACEGNTTLILLDQSHHRYRVSGIDYDTHTVSLVGDAEAFNTTSCPLLHFNLTIDTSSPLHLTSSDSNITFFYNCTKNASWPSAVELRGCPDYSKSSYVFTGDGYTGEAYEYGCEATVVAPVLDVHKESMGDVPLDRRYADMLMAGFELNYSPHSGQCGICESSGGWCGYQHNQTNGSLGFTCFCNGGPTTDKCGSKGKGKAAIGGVVAGAAGLFLVAAGIVFFLIRRRKQRKVVNSSSKLLKYSGSGGTPTRSRDGFDLESGSVQGMGSRFSYEELEEATDSFNENRELGDGGFGTVYKGYLEDGRVVAVKKLYNNSYRRVEQFVNEAAILARLRHPNLVMFYGCTSKESRDLLLVYEFVQNGTVADHLHGHRAQERALPWPLRLNIAIESAAALTYLHAIEPPIIHRDVKTNNILLDGDFHVKVADFGLSRLFPLDVTHVSTAPQGTPGYVDPEYHQCYQLTDKSDVYSFGVVLVELISSKPAVDITRQRNEINLAGMAINRIQKCQLEELVDLQLGYESDPATKKMMTMVAELAFRCLQQNGEMRPPIKEVHDVLRAIKDGSVAENGGVGKDKDLEPPFSPNTVHAPWDSRSTTPNTSQ
ncbi:LEAF RUST 10 DISEASE-RESISTANCEUS RECEPTOR-LIKE PROTEIN KINASE-like 1.2 isoform X4 [Lolium perenne]|uniref:LEAF RUST 10 DISEASE-RESISTANCEUS RECEPTOR-LIKE PROTEIN KINASE-like 1.2 isoform X4 n=1 Tax=Lolium perenne TaxID=4522 RepID=UPI0021F528B4|nr:LEAF RUST 10 DISEASE-RESISTANCE LOCUS RECEPTOR-LIKE PROTEIN KINASE-like 1.2 isoform X3 [Lolium perenne]